MKQFWIMAIAVGLWANAAALWLGPAQAQQDATSILIKIDRNIKILIQGGAGCNNAKICD